MIVVPTHTHIHTQPPQAQGNSKGLGQPQHIGQKVERPGEPPLLPEHLSCLPCCWDNQPPGQAQPAQDWPTPLPPIAQKSSPSALPASSRWHTAPGYQDRPEQRGFALMLNEVLTPRTCEHDLIWGQGPPCPLVLQRAPTPPLEMFTASHLVYRKLLLLFIKLLPYLCTQIWKICGSSCHYVLVLLFH